MRADYIALQGVDQESLSSYEYKKVKAAIEGVINSLGTRTVAMIRHAIEVAGYSGNSKDAELTIEPQPAPDGTLYGRGRGIHVLCKLKGPGYDIRVEVTGK